MSNLPSAKVYYALNLHHLVDYDCYHRDAMLFDVMINVLWMNRHFHAVNANH